MVTGQDEQDALNGGNSPSIDMSIYMRIVRLINTVEGFFVFASAL